MPQDGHTELIDAKGYVKKDYPGVYGEVRYFARYRVEFDLKTSVEVQFQYIVVNGDTLPVNSVRVGNKIINTASGEHLSENADDVRVVASKPVKQSSSEVNSHAGDLNEIVIHYTTKNGSFQEVVKDIHQEASQYRPSVGPGPGNR